MSQRRVRFASGLLIVAGLLLVRGCGEEDAASVSPPPCPQDFKADSGEVIGAATGDVASTVAARICTYDVTPKNVFSPVIQDVQVPDEVLDGIVAALRRGESDSGPSSKPGACGESGMRQYWFFGVTASGEGTVMGATDCAFLTGVPPESTFGKLIA